MIDKKCPKCGSKSFQLIDSYVADYIFEVEDGRVIADGMDDVGGEHVRALCVCRECSHQWHPKNLTYTIDE